MRLVGITGVSGSGKTTLGAFLAAALLEAGHLSRLEAFGLPLRTRARQLFGFFDKDRHREWMQETGANWRRFNPDMLLNDLLRRNNLDAADPGHPREDGEDGPADFLIVADVRHRNEAEYCAGNGVLIMREGCRTPLAPARAEHISESGVVELLPLCGIVAEQQPDLERLAAWAARLVATNRFFQVREGPRGGKE